jgi:hypothetical protein
MSTAGMPSLFFYDSARLHRAPLILIKCHFGYDEASRSFNRMSYCSRSCHARTCALQLLHISTRLYLSIHHRRPTYTLDKWNRRINIAQRK